MHYENLDTRRFRADFERNGWVVIEGVFTRADADRIAQLAVEHVDHYLPPDDATGVGEPRKVTTPFLKDEAFRRFALDERLTELLSLLMDGERPLLAVDQIFMKPPRHGSAKPYHQDNAYFQCDPADQTITAWIALDDVSEENGCLRYIDGSHRGPLLEHRPIPGEAHHLTPDPTQIDLSRESLAPVGKGGVVFHHSNTLHTSHRNESDRWRRAYATHWVSSNVTSRSSVLDDAYFKRDVYAAAV